MDETREDPSGKREKNEYFDVFFGLFNSFVMGFMVWITQNNLILAVLTYIFVFIMTTGIIFTFKIKNPFYHYFTLGALGCGSFYALPGLFLIPSTNFHYGIIDFIIFSLTIPEIYYILMLLKGSSFLETYGKQALVRERAVYDPSLHYALMDPETLHLQRELTLETELKEQEKINKYNKKYHKSLIMSLSIISALGFIVLYFSGIGL